MIDRKSVEYKTLYFNSKFADAEVQIYSPEQLHFSIKCHKPEASGKEIYFNVAEFCAKFSLWQNEVADVMLPTRKQPTSTLLYILPTNYLLPTNQ